MPILPHYRTVRSGALDIAVIDEGEGEPVLLIHGFASSAAFNWFHPGWVDAIVRAGRRAIAFDNRGHGHSDRPHDAAAYTLAAMADDARAVLDARGVEDADVVGYSMGARIAAMLALTSPDRVLSLTLGGIGAGLASGTRGADRIIAAMEAPTLADVTDPLGQNFRAFAERTGSDLVALAACMRAGRESVAVERLAELALPILIALGTEDHIAGPPEPLIAMLPNAGVLLLPGRDHMKAVGDPALRRGVLDFLGRRP